MAFWTDLFRLFSYSFTDDPISQRDNRPPRGAGYSQPDGMPDFRGNSDGIGGPGGGSVRLRDTNDFVDLSTVTNRMHRYKEYERLRSMAEVEMAMTVFADEACLGGETLVTTPAYDSGTRSMEWLEQNLKGQRFLVYAYDFDKDDFTLAWAHDPRVVREAETIKFLLEDGTSFVVTADHRILMKDGTWKTAGQLRMGDLLMPFYRIAPNHELTGLHVNQHPRIYTNSKGWITERQFVDEWRFGKDLPKYEKVNRYCRMIVEGLTLQQMEELVDATKITIRSTIEKAGWSNSELKWLANRPTERRILGIVPNGKQKVYDLSVEKHENFCTNWGVVHNCQEGENGHVLEITCENKEVKEELEFLLFHRKMLNFDQKKIWNRFKNTAIMGDDFWEIIINPENPKDGVIDLQFLPPDSMYRIETTQGRLVEFQQSKEGPDYQSLSRVDITQATDADLQQATAIRFAPEQIIHVRIGDDRKTFYPYGVSLVEAARGPAHQLRLMEDSMIVYRLSRAPERRVFYIDVAQLPPHKAEAFIERMKDQFRKKKVPKSSGPEGASSVEERWHAPAADEDFWIPIRANANTRVETLPGACLALDTKIPLLDGRTLELKEIIAEHEAGKELWAYSCCPTTGKVAPGLISWAGVTRRNAEVVKVTLDNGESIICTPDHKFPVQGKGKVQAKDLEPGCSLFPFQRRFAPLSDSWKSQYEKVYDSSLRDWVFTHRMVANSVFGTEFAQVMEYRPEFQNEKKTVIHHVNIDRRNNAPTNLAWMGYRDHKKYHRDHQADTNAKISQALRQYHENLCGDKKDALYADLAKKGKKGIASLTKKLRDSKFSANFRDKQRQGWADSKQVNPELHSKRGLKISARNKEFWANPENKKQAFDKQRIVFPDSFLDNLKSHLKQGLTVDEFIEIFNRDEEALASLKQANGHLKRSNANFAHGLQVYHVDKAIKAMGFATASQVRLGVTGGDTSEEMVWPDSIWNFLVYSINSGDSMEQSIDKINANDAFALEFAQVNAGNFGKGFRFKGKFTPFYIKQLVRSKGYKDARHLKREASNYNHKVVSVEVLNDRQDTGTLTIDANHKIHNYHTFATNANIYIFNSNLGEIDDTVYFRNKLFIALNFPKNYFNNEDVQTTRISLSAQDVKFARMIERLQSHMEDAFWELCDRHLKLRGFPEEAYEDLVIKMTPPSDWRELTRAEVISGRIQNAGSIKGAQLWSDFDILTQIMKFSEEDAKMMIARLKIQKLDDLKLQIMASNPQLVGVGLPPDDEEQVSSEPSMDNPMMGGQPDQGPTPDMTGGAPPSPPEQPGTMMALPEPSNEDIHKYDLEIRDYSSEMDQEERDASQDG